MNSFSEFELIDNIKSWIGKQQSVVGIGDDAAVVDIPKNKLVVSTDALIERVHFLDKTTNFMELGWKSLAVNISDIAAMGALPKFVVITFGVTQRCSLKDLKNFYRGFKELADIAGVELIGGDTIKSPRDIFISVTIFGELISNKPFLRSGVNVGDLLCVSGDCGNAGYGLSLLKKNRQDVFFRRAFNKPMPRFKLAEKIAKQNLANAMMDISDGLIAAVCEVSKQSNVGFKLFYDRFPLGKQLARRENRKNAMKYVLYGGEDYELLYTINEKDLEKIKKINPEVYVIGTATKQRNIVCVDDNNKNIELCKKGYDAFRK